MQTPVNSPKRPNQLSSAGDLYLGHYSGANGASAWGYGGSPRIGDLNVNVPSTLRSGRSFCWQTSQDLVLLRQDLMAASTHATVGCNRF